MRYGLFAIGTINCMDQNDMIFTNPKGYSLDELLVKYPALRHAKEYGVDIQMLLDNLKRPISERIRRSQIASDTLMELQSAQAAVTKSKE